MRYDDAIVLNLGDEFCDQRFLFRIECRNLADWGSCLCVYVGSGISDPGTNSGLFFNKASELSILWLILAEFKRFGR
jgi:hypothetical protein